MRVKLAPLLLLCLVPLSVQAAPDLIALGPFGGDVRSLLTHPARPEQVFLGTADGQIYVSDNWGKAWRKISPGIGRRELVLDSLAFDPRDPDVLWVGGWELKSDRGGLYRSEDGGKSWQKIDLGIFESSIRAVAVAPSSGDTVAVGITEGVLLTRDGGTSWERITRGYRSLYDVHSLAFDPTDETVLYVGTWRLAWKTTSLGKSWTPIHAGMFWDSDLFSIQLNPRTPQILLAGACSGVYRSTNGGERWERLRNGIPSEAKRTRVVRFDPLNPSTVYAGTTEGLFRSKNGGDSWECLLPGVVLNSVLIHPGESGRILLGTDDAGVLTSEDGGRTFTASNQGFSHRQISHVSARSGSGEEYFAAVSLDSGHGGFFWSTDMGRTWKVFNEGLGSLVAVVRTILPSSTRADVFLATVRGVYSGIPGRQEWGPLPGTEKLLVNGIAFADTSEERLLIASRSGAYIYDREDRRLSRLKIPVYDREFFSAFFDATEGVAYLGTEMGVFRSEDAGKTWIIAVEGLPYTAVNNFCKVDGRMFAATRIGVFYSDNQGKHWRQGSGIFPIDIVAVEAGDRKGEVVAADPQIGYLFRSLDHGETWEPIDVGQELSRVSSLRRTPSGQLLAGTVAEGVYRIILNPESTLTSGGE